MHIFLGCWHHNYNLLLSRAKMNLESASLNAWLCFEEILTWRVSCVVCPSTFREAVFEAVSFISQLVKFAFFRHPIASVLSLNPSLHDLSRQPQKFWYCERSVWGLLAPRVAWQSHRPPANLMFNTVREKEK